MNFLLSHLHLLLQLRQAAPTRLGFGVSGLQFPHALEKEVGGGGGRSVVVAVQPAAEVRHPVSGGRR